MPSGLASASPTACRRLQPGGIWVHAVSVGESIAAAPMIRALLQRYPQLPITVTCMTPTGSERIQALFANEPRIQHCYLPYDLPCAAARFLDRAQPKLAVIMETELWPNHIHQCAKRGIPVALANGRLVRTFGPGLWPLQQTDRADAGRNEFFRGADRSRSPALP